MDEDIRIKYDIINPVVNEAKPKYVANTNTFLFPVKKQYRYYVEVRTIDATTGDVNYFILLSNSKFDDNCRLCEVNGYAKCKFHPRGELQQYIERECKERGNITCDLVNTTDNYDVYAII